MNTENGYIDIIHADGDPEKVFRNIYNFSDLRKVSEPKEGPLLFILGGGQRGVYGGGGVSALEDLKLNNGFKTVVGISTGSPAVSYFLAGQANLGTSIYYEENTGDEFINLQGMDITWLCNQVFRQGTKKLNIEKVFENPTDIFFTATDANTGLIEILNAKKIPDIVEGIRASCAVPELYKDEVILKINGKNERVVDGGVASSFPVREILNIIEPTSILVFANTIKPHRDNYIKKFLRKYISLVVNWKLEKDLLYKENKLIQEVKFLKKYCKKNSIPYCIIWTDGNVGPLEKKSEKLKQAGEDFKNFVLKLARQ